MPCYCNYLNVNCKSSQLYYELIENKFDTDNWYVSDLTQSSQDNILLLHSLEIIYYLKYKFDKPIYFVYSLDDKINVSK